MGKIFNDIKKHPNFNKDFKKLSKKFRTLKDDLELFIETQLNAYHKFGEDNKGILPISNLSIEYPKIYKVKKFACKSLKGKGVMSGIRIIYAYYNKEDIIEFIEIYYKSDKSNENKKRILNYYKNNN